MSLRKVHGRAAELGNTTVVVETRPLDEQPAGRRAQPVGDAPGDRRADGTFAPGNSLAARGGKARADKARFETELANTLGLPEVPADMAPMVDAARDWVETETRWLASTVGGGVAGPDVGAIIQSAGRAWFAHLAVYRRAVDADNDPKLHIQAAALADKARNWILTARDLCATAAETRPDEDPITALRRRAGVDG